LPRGAGAAERTPGPALSPGRVAGLRRQDPGPRRRRRGDPSWRPDRRRRRPIGVVGVAPSGRGSDMRPSVVPPGIHAPARARGQGAQGGVLVPGVGCETRGGVRGMLASWARRSSCGCCAWRRFALPAAAISIDRTLCRPTWAQFCLHRPSPPRPAPPRPCRSATRGRGSPWSRHAGTCPAWTAPLGTGSAAPSRRAGEMGWGHLPHLRRPPAVG
jgi:hypothetical protein